MYVLRDAIRQKFIRTKRKTRGSEGLSGDVHVEQSGDVFGGL